MIKETKIMKEDVERHKFCDDCGTEIRIGIAYSMAQCGYCKKDLCEKCVGHEEHSCSDYRGQIWCRTCWVFGNKYRPKIAVLEQEIEDMYKEWQTKCSARKDVRNEQ